jgi:hypothetical protein
MLHFPLLVRYVSYTNTINFPKKIGSSLIHHFSSAINIMKKTNFDKNRIVYLNFSAAERVYSSGMLGIIAIIQKLISEGYCFQVILPKNGKMAALYQNTNWAHFMAPTNYKYSIGTDRLLCTRNFKDDKDIADLTNEFMDLVLRTMYMPKDVISALEWSIYEICDNVINHADSKLGGYIEGNVFLNEKRVGFTVADAGRGIFNTRKESYPDLHTSSAAISEAIKEGVTRNTSIGQGNGLAGSSRITTMTGGSFDITSGSGRVFLTPKQFNKIEQEPNFAFEGTCVSGCIMMNSDFSIGSALVFKGVEYFPSNIVDLQYEHPDEDLFILKLKQEPAGVGTRKAGRQMHTKVLNLMNTNPDYPVHIDWEGVNIIASSFADEFIGKLYLKIGQELFLSKIKNINLTPTVAQLLGKAIEQRTSVGKTDN